MAKKGKKFPADNTENVLKQSETREEKSTIVKPKKYKIVFRENRKKELYVNGGQLVFSPESQSMSAIVNEDFINHILNPGDSVPSIRSERQRLDA